MNKCFISFWVSIFCTITLKLETKTGRKEPYFLFVISFASVLQTDLLFHGVGHFKTVRTMYVRNKRQRNRSDDLRKEVLIYAKITHIGLLPCYFDPS